VFRRDPGVGQPTPATARSNDPVAKTEFPLLASRKETVPVGATVPPLCHHSSQRVIPPSPGSAIEVAVANGPVAPGHRQRRWARNTAGIRVGSDERGLKAVAADPRAELVSGLAGTRQFARWQECECLCSMPPWHRRNSLP